jgi:hypothetical protein
MPLVHTEVVAGHRSGQMPKALAAEPAVLFREPTAVM